MVVIIDSTIIQNHSHHRCQVGSSQRNVSNNSVFQVQTEASGASMWLAMLLFSFCRETIRVPKRDNTFCLRPSLRSTTNSQWICNMGKK